MFFVFSRRYAGFATRGGIASGAITAADAALLLKCSNLCLIEIDDDEFATRLGESAEFGRRTNTMLAKYARDDSPILVAM